MIGRFIDAVAVVTAAGGGIGGAIARRLAAEGAAAVVCIDRNERVLALPSELREAGADAIALQLSCDDEAAVADAFDQVQQRYGRVDVLVNGVGGGPHPPMQFYCSSSGDWQTAIDRSLMSAMLCTHRVVQGMRERRAGRIVNIGSSVALLPVPAMVPYGTAKTALIGFTRALALELAPFGVTVNVVSPGPIETRAVAALPNAVREHSRQQIPMGYVGQPEDVAGAVAYLASPEARYITGQNLAVNGGRAFN